MHARQSKASWLDVRALSLTASWPAKKECADGRRENFFFFSFQRKTRGTSQPKGFQCMQSSCVSLSLHGQLIPRKKLQPNTQGKLRLAGWLACLCFVISHTSLDSSRTISRAKYELRIKDYRACFFFSFEFRRRFVRTR